MTEHESVAANEHGTAQLRFDSETHLAHYPHFHGSPDDDLDGVAQRAAAGLLGGLDDEKARRRRSSISPEDWARYEANLAEILTSLGLDLGTPGTGDTPRRLMRALYDATEGYDGDPKLVTVFPTECHGGASCELSQVVEGPIPFSALCEHHALPFLGRAFVGYIAHENIIGISKLTRLVRIATRRFGVQERMTHQIAEALAAHLRPDAWGVKLVAVHTCMSHRGVKTPDVPVSTLILGGAWLQDPPAAFRSDGAFQ